MACHFIDFLLKKNFIPDGFRTDRSDVNFSAYFLEISKGAVRHPGGHIVPGVG